MNNVLGIVFGIIIAIIAAVLLVTGFTGVDVESQNTQTCKSPGVVSTEVSGTFSVVDSKIIGVEPEIDKIESIGLQFRKLAISEPYDIAVNAFDQASGKKIAEYQGRGSLESNEDSSIESFFLRYKVPDNDCNGIIDDHSINIEISIEETEDLFKNDDIETFSCNIANGVITC